MKQSAGRTRYRTVPPLAALVSTLVAAAMARRRRVAGGPSSITAPSGGRTDRSGSCPDRRRCRGELLGRGERRRAPTASSGQAAVRTTIGVAKSMGVPLKGQIVAVMVMFQETTIRNLANDGTSTQNASWPVPGRDYWMNVTRLSLKYPHDKFGLRDGAHDTDSVGLYQQRPSYGWGNYGSSTGTTDPEGVIQRLLDPRWEAMAFFGGVKSAAPTSGLLDVPGWENMAPTYAANAVQGSNYPELYAQWEGQATTYVNNNQDAPAVTLPWYPGGGGGALTCTSIPTDPALGEAGRNPFGSLDGATCEGTGIRVAGWAFDPTRSTGWQHPDSTDRARSAPQLSTGVANQPRADVDRVYNVVGQLRVQRPPAWTGAGQHTVCAYGDQHRPRHRQPAARLPRPRRARAERLHSTRSLHRAAEIGADPAGPPTPAAPAPRRRCTSTSPGRSASRAQPGTHDRRCADPSRPAVPWAGGTTGLPRHRAERGPGRQPGSCALRDQRRSRRAPTRRRVPAVVVRSTRRRQPGRNVCAGAQAQVTGWTSWTRTPPDGVDRRATST